MQYQGQRMNLAPSLPQYRRTSGSEPGVVLQVSPSFQLNRFSECPELLGDSLPTPTWFCSLEPPNKLAVPKWIGFHCDRLIKSLRLHLAQVTATQSAQRHLHRLRLPQHRAQLPSLTEGCSRLQSPPVTSHGSSPRGGQTIYKKDRPSPLVRCLVPARPVGIPPGVSVLACHPQPGRTSKLGKDRPGLGHIHQHLL